jgi:hypothetical protein
VHEAKHPARLLDEIRDVVFIGQRLECHAWKLRLNTDGAVNAVIVSLDHSEDLRHQRAGLAATRERPGLAIEVTRRARVDSDDELALASEG